MKQERYACMLLFNDPHISKDNIEEFQKNWDEALQICQEHGIEDIVIGGDLFQSRAGQTLAVLIAVMQAFEKARAFGIEVTIAEGNHDKVDQEAILGYCHIFGSHENVYVVDDFVTMDFGDGCTLTVMSYFPESGSFLEHLKEAESKLSSEDFNILYCHEGINGALARPVDKELPTKVFDGFNKVLAGHYHDRCKIPGTNIEYIGASRQQNYGEDMDKGYTILYSNGTTEFIQNQVNTRFCTLEAENVEQAKEMIEKNSNEKTRVKVRITCASDVAATIDKAALLDLGASKVEVVAETSDSCAKVDDFEAKYDKSGIKEEYSRFCKQKEIENIELGLHYLDYIN